MNLDDKLAEIHEIPFPAVSNLRVLEYVIFHLDFLLKVTICTKPQFPMNFVQDNLDAYRADKQDTFR
jgi:hypothetical protein